MIVREYLTRAGVSLYRRWLETLDLSVRARVEARVLRFEMGNLGDHRQIVLAKRIWADPGRE